MSDNPRAILTDREREILRADGYEDAGISERYYYKVISGIRDKIERLEDDAEILEEEYPRLYDDLLEVIETILEDIPEEELEALVDESS
jgi:archaellum component FlaC